MVCCDCTLTMTSAPLIRQVLINVICLIIVYLPVILLQLLGKPFQRGFYCDDTSIRYPYKDSTVTSAMLYGYSYVLPIVSIIIVEIVRWKLSSPSQNLSSRNTSSTINSSSRIRIPSEVVEVIHLIAIFLFGAACTEWATDFGKYFIGRLRPHFLSICQPDNFLEICPPNGLPIYITQFKCTGKNGQRLQDSRMSFPSGHASFSSYAMLYLVLYLQSRMNWSGSKLLRPTIQIAALMLTWYTGLSRITDYKHHWSDVLTGFLIGSTAASLTVLYVSSFFNRPRSSSNMALLQERGDVELQTAASANK
ncbi:putative phosphatidate phosphatase [Daphnia pulex]|uniref:putative phosphatidate phosphatase n=1 Tax=Daphnia pulex TaxID=6669 RepID=UPI001EDF0E3E|nr:putative phosphatidate phosphatase [Daphnia pulex]